MRDLFNVPQPLSNASAIAATGFLIGASAIPLLGLTTTAICLMMLGTGVTTYAFLIANTDFGRANFMETISSSNQPILLSSSNRS